VDTPNTHAPSSAARHLLIAGAVIASALVLDAIGGVRSPLAHVFTWQALTLGVGLFIAWSGILGLLVHAIANAVDLVRAALKGRVRQRSLAPLLVTFATCVGLAALWFERDPFLEYAAAKLGPPRFVVPLGHIALALGLTAGHFAFLAVALFGVRTPGLRRVTSALLLSLGAAACVADNNIWVALYPSFHVFMLVIEVASFWRAWQLIVPAQPPLAQRNIAVLTGAIGLVAAAFGLSCASARADTAERIPFLYGTTAAAKLLIVQNGLLGSRLTAVSAPEQAVALAVPPPTTTTTRQAPLCRSSFMFVIDGLRWDHVGLAGYGEHPTTPTLDAWASRSVTFDVAYAPSPATKTSVAAFFLGAPVTAHPALLDAAQLRTIASALQAEGLATHCQLHRGEMKKYSPKLYEQLGCDSLIEAQLGEPQLQAFEAFVKSLAPGARAFAYVHVMDSHGPYPRVAGFDFGSSVQARYAGSIAYADDKIRRMLKVLEDADQLRESCIAFTSDHGEALGDHGSYWRHSSSLFEEQLRVPLLLHVPGVAPRRVKQAVSVTSVGSTLVEALGAPPGPWAKSSLLRARDDVRPAVVIAAFPPKGLSMISDGKLKLIEDTDRVSLLVFSLKDDPRELSPMNLQLRADEILALRRKLREAQAEQR
jgi:membrane-anchored protein YejM (alkaline phosphatase superfamily)